MKLLVFYRQTPGTHPEYHDFIGQLEKSRMKYEVIDPDSREGSARAELYEVLSFPTAALVDDDGRPLAIWRDNLPSTEEISTYLFV